MATWKCSRPRGRALGLIDWDRAGPVDRLVELAQDCWLNPKLQDEVVAEREGLPSADERAPATVHDAADEANLAKITADTTADELHTHVPWALAWRSASAFDRRQRAKAASRKLAGWLTASL